jgi:mannose-1-phosphate guanylyltransferase
MPAAMVLCAGLGTRLRPLTDHIPKPLMPVGDRSALAHVLGALRSAGIDRIALNTHHRAEAFDAHGEELGRAALSILYEPEILGTAGGVRNARGALGRGDVLVYNGDIVAPELDIFELYSAWEKRNDTAALWVIEPKPAGEGTVGVDQRGRIVRLRGRMFGRETASGDYLGIQIMGEEIRDKLPKTGCLVGDVAMPFLEAGGGIGTFPFRDRWDDIGNAAGLLRANLGWLERRGGAAWVGAGAQVEAGVTLVSSVVGPRAAVDGRGEARECLVFSGARARAPMQLTIVSQNATVRI